MDDCHDSSVRTRRARAVLRSRRGRGRAEPRLCLRAEEARHAAARLGRSLFLPSRRGRRHPGRDEARHRVDRHRPAARHGRGHRRHARRDRAAVRREHRPPGRRRHQARRARSPVREHQAGREPAQAGAGDVGGHPRAAGEARRPPAQHADPALHQGPGEAPAHRPRDHGHLRAARRAHRHGEGQARARGAGLRRAQSRRPRVGPGAPGLPARAAASGWCRRSRPS